MTSLVRRIDDAARRNPWAVWLAGCSVYFLALLHRSSLGVAGPAAVERLDISAAQLGTFVTVQLGIYAAMQVPAGLLIDRLGPRRVLLVAALVMASGQVAFAFADSYGLALGARALLGLGDSAVYLSCLRLVAEWFPQRRYAVLTMWTGLFGMAGNLVATVPLTWALGELGWVRTFLLTGLTSLAATVLLLRPAVTAPFRSAEAHRAEVADDVAHHRPRRFAGVVDDVRSAWRGTELGRGTQVGFWTHQATMAGGTVLAMVWGFPYLTDALGYTPDAAAGTLSLFIVATLAFSFLIGPLAGRRRGWRMPIAIVTSSAGIAALLTLVAWPGGPPRWAVTLAFLVLAAGGPASQVGFHLARDYNPRRRISTATGLVNIGGFSAAMVGAVVVGLILDVLAPDGSPSPTDYRWALSAIVVISTFSTCAMVLSLLRLRRLALGRIAAGEEVALPVVAHWWDVRERRSRG
ncbi:MFS transporter [Litorihabitans aurantiacus]|uniref:MFS transporter n=1 Tax=Litorihabitans aurantiacus TaxID=1930061 RepID=A0AA37XCL0_9MICO|nr:MFS transporter [Litorihabitans aurantiacus]GMA30015.1 MFS transporter [Litorihabitans aurantiacus]GMA33463.1 MFS transporter [Litorihabitans aurantiacus]